MDFVTLPENKPAPPAFQLQRQRKGPIHTHLKDLHLFSFQ
jgi:hypothetical protein